MKLPENELGKQIQDLFDKDEELMVTILSWVMKRRLYLLKKSKNTFKKSIL